MYTVLESVKDDYATTIAVLGALKKFYEKSIVELEAHNLQFWSDYKSKHLESARPFTYVGQYTEEEFLVCEDSLYIKVKDEYKRVLLESINYSDYPGFNSDGRLMNLYCQAPTNYEKIWRETRPGLKFVCRIKPERFISELKRLSG